MDAGLAAAIRAGKLAIGDKLLIASAGKGGGDVPAPPLEAYSSVWLCLSINGTRRAPWDAPLGRVRRFPLSPLRVVRAGGGGVPGCAVTITRVHPLIYLEKTVHEDAEGVVTETKHMRSAAAEAAAASAHEARAERVREGAAAAAADAAQRQRDTRRRSAAPPTADTAADHARADAREEAAASAAIAFAVQAALEEAKALPRDVMALFKLSVTGFVPIGSDQSPGEATITRAWRCACLVVARALTHPLRVRVLALLPVWRPDEGALSTLVEGATFVVTGLVAGGDGGGAFGGDGNAVLPPRGLGRDGGALELSAPRATWLRARPGVGCLRGLRSGYAPRRCVPLSALGAPTVLPALAPPPPPLSPVIARAIEDARRGAAVAAASAGAGADACNAAAEAAAAAALAAHAPPPAAPLPPPPHAIRLNGTFDAVGILVHVAPPRCTGPRGRKQFAFLVDPSLVTAAAAQAQPGQPADPSDITLLALEARECPECALT